jgi:hypothetical protein
MDAKRPELEIVSGCQSGVDRAALDAALEAGVPCGGWCPKGRAAEDGPIDARYPLHETPSSEVQQRTEWNVRDSDGTLILSRGTELTGGTLLTQRLAQQRGKPCLAIDLNARPSPRRRDRLDASSPHPRPERGRPARERRTGHPPASARVHDGAPGVGVVRG